VDRGWSPSRRRGYQRRGRERWGPGLPSAGQPIGSMGSVYVPQEKVGHGIVHEGLDKPQYGGSGFASMGSIAVEKEKVSHGIVHEGLDKPQYGGSGFASMGSIAVEKEKVSHGIIRGDQPVNNGPIDSSSDAMGAEIKARNEAKLDPKRVEKVRAWLSSVAGEDIGEDLQAALKSGVILCKTLNAVYPKSVAKINDSKVAFMQIENIGNYLKACGILGFNKSLIFETADLFENRNFTIVIDNLYELGKIGTRKSIGTGVFD